MAGSLTWREYTSDNGVPYAIRVDESNARGAFTGGGADPLCPPRATDVPPLPNTIKPRYLLAYNQAKPVQKRKFILGDAGQIESALTVGATITAEQYPGAADTAGNNVTWVVTFYSGEKQKLVPAVSSPDTGLTDGSTGQ